MAAIICTHSKKPSMTRHRLTDRKEPRNLCRRLPFVLIITVPVCTVLRPLIMRCLPSNKYHGPVPTPFSQRLHREILQLSYGSNRIIDRRGHAARAQLSLLLSIKKIHFNKYYNNCTKFAVWYSIATCRSVPETAHTPTAALHNEHLSKETTKSQIQISYMQYVQPENPIPQHCPCATSSVSCHFFQISIKTCTV